MGRAFEAGFDAATACRGPFETLLAAKPKGSPETVEDPTAHFGFTTPVSKDNHGETLSSDLAWAQRDLNLPITERRVIVTALKSIDDDDGATVGVLKVGLVAGQLSEKIRQIQVNPLPDTSFKVFLCDGGGRLITGFAENDVPVEDDDDLRVDAACAPPEVAQALASGMLRKMFEERQPESDGVVEHDGKRYLVSFRHLPDTQGWNVGVVGPESYYYGRLEEQRRDHVVGEHRRARAGEPARRVLAARHSRLVAHHRERDGAHEPLRICSVEGEVVVR